MLLTSLQLNLQISEGVTLGYCVDTDVRLFAPQAKDGEVFTGWIEQSDRVIDANLRTFYDVPFTTTPGLITNISSKLSAAEYLKAKYGAINQDPPKHAYNLYNEAMAMLKKIKGDPSLLGLELRAKEALDDSLDGVMVSDTKGSVFESLDPRDW